MLNSFTIQDFLKHLLIHWDTYLYLNNNLAIHMNYLKLVVLKILHEKIIVSI